ncbi:hypothetical protein PFICI_11354 [Pestalotiopsis fici W106-1]|uniref:Uncharacterized protein n=1 Tax=Pestalotiopsis fici (strain W106-1 / CGMCC3.15140) TaxID=1229662 RepID=W3WUF5_PESFW|nr:uncharacterized protein PFICI_11354 [Pestalotiopsis fici W106-1]ETS77480.1 hypothetical protein PFICI_11354 [Pestalotiopsis fici W106-1]
MDSHSPDFSNSSSNDLNNAGKIAVGICSTIAAMAVIFVIWCLRRRKRSAKGYMQTPPPMTRAFKAHYQEPSDSHASLITTTTTPPPPPPPPPPPAATASGAKSPQPLTPPMRLSDRRFLPSVSSPASIRSSSAPPYSSQPDLVIPEHPAFPSSTHRNSPPYCHHETTSSMEEKNTQIYNSHNINIPRSSLSSGGTASTTGSETTLTSPSSPSRPRRPHETPLLVPGLITPAGPPPERALPAAPLLPQQQQQQQLVLASSPLLKSSSRSPASSSPVAPVSPLSPTSPSMQTTLARSVSPVPSPGEIGLAIGTAQDDGVSAPSQVHHARGRGNRGTQDSGWGIWMGGSGNKDNKDGDATMQRQQEQAGSTEHSLRLADRKNDQIGVDIVLRELEMAKLSGSC